MSQRLHAFFTSRTAAQAHLAERREWSMDLPGRIRIPGQSDDLVATVVVDGGGSLVDISFQGAAGLSDVELSDRVRQAHAAARHHLSIELEGLEDAVDSPAVPRQRATF